MELERPARTREQVIRDFRTSEILGAARRVIAEIGFGDASMERIAQEAGVSKGTIYLYFDGKEALLVEALKRAFDLLMERTRSAARRARGSRAKLRAVGPSSSRSRTGPSSDPKEHPC
jgi:AcrR family transcriptional regulator